MNCLQTKHSIVSKYNGNNTRVVNKIQKMFLSYLCFNISSYNDPICLNNLSTLLWVGCLLVAYINIAGGRIKNRPIRYLSFFYIVLQVNQSTKKNIAMSMLAHKHCFFLMITKFLYIGPLVGFINIKKKSLHQVITAPDFP